MNTDYVDDWWTTHNDKTIYALTNADSEYKVTYRNEDGKKFQVILKPKRYQAGFLAKW